MQTRAIRGMGAAPGIAIGPVFRYELNRFHVEPQHVEDVQQELARLEDALAQARQEMQLLLVQAQQKTSAKEASIFEAHELFLSDPELLQQVRTIISDEQYSAAYAWQEATRQYVEELRSLDDDYLAARAIDMDDVAQRVQRILQGEENHTVEFREPVVIVANDLTPSETIQFEREKIRAFCIALGGPTSHVAILAKALGLPAITGLGAAIDRLHNGDTVIVDGSSGDVLIAPDPQTLASYRDLTEARARLEQSARLVAQQPARTRDGTTVEVVANIGGLEQVPEALAYGAEGIGLFRTEFMYMEREGAPGEEEQTKIYRSVLEAMTSVSATSAVAAIERPTESVPSATLETAESHGLTFAVPPVSETRPVVVRTFDIGGDKPLPYLPLPHEMNPFLGVRGIRLALARPELFQTQLRALLRAGVGYNLKIMFPMVTSWEEIEMLYSQLEQARRTLAARGVTCAEAKDVEIGVMIEVPAAALMADRLAERVDFFSIGTNDLAQYTLAVDRGNAAVAPLADALHPAVLRLIRQVSEAAHAHGKWVGLCGELASDPLATPVLLGLGLDELSMTARAIPLIKQKIRHCSIAHAREIADKVLRLNNAREVREYLLQVEG
jgi:phosphotransferase system enzyme I (PtsI)